MTDSKKPSTPRTLSADDLRLSKLCGIALNDIYDRPQVATSVPVNTHKLYLPNSTEAVDVKSWPFPSTQTVQSSEGDSYRLTRQSQWVVVVPDIPGFTIPVGSSLQLKTASSIYKMTSPAFIKVAGRPVQDVLDDINTVAPK